MITFSDADKWGRFSVVIEKFGSIHGCSYKQGTSKEGKPYEFIAVPTRPYEKKDGTKAYSKDIELAPEMQGRILAAYKAAHLAVQPDDQDIPF